MPKPLSKSEIAAVLADKAGITKKQAISILAQIAQLAYKNAKNTFVLPGIGKLFLVNRAARMGRNPATGLPIAIRSKKVLKFRISKAAEKSILGSKVASPIHFADEGDTDTDAR